MSPAKEARALILVGPTASGKSAAAMALADVLPLEIISVDSAQVYRGLDIGSAKPTLIDRVRVPHHLIDILDPVQAYSAARFVEDATVLIAEVHARGKLPLLVGGTMLYVNALRSGLHELPAADADVRAKIEAEAAQLGWPALHRQLAIIDPPTASRLAPNDAQRIQRALEVYAVSGKPISAWFAEAQQIKPAASDQFRVLSLEPGERAGLHARIARRFEQMISQGLIDEVRRLRERPDLHAGLPAMRSVGYRQVWEWLDQTGPARVNTLIEAGIAATRQLAKRQLTWLRAMPQRTIIDCLAPDATDQVVAAAKSLWQG